MAGNVHKDEVSAVKIPTIATSEDRGLSRCEKPIQILATLTSTQRYKNDLTGVALIADTLTVELEDSSGNLTTAPGESVSFPYQSNASGFVIDWRQVTRNLGTEIATDCYKVKLSGTTSGISFSYYYGAFDLNVWSMQLARNTVQVFSVLNDVVRKDGINYKDSGFCNSVRFKGSFGFMQPNYETTNLTYTDRTRKKVNNEALRTYELRTSYLLGCVTEMIDEQHLLAANSIWITEHNPLSHIQYIEFPVILDEDTSPSLEYPAGVYAKLTAVFKDKVAVHQSKYDGNIEANENVSFDLPNGLVCSVGCDPATYLVENTASREIASGDILSGGSATIIVPDSQINVNSVDQGDVVSVQTIDVNLSDSVGAVTPVAINLTGNTLAITLADSTVSPDTSSIFSTGQAGDPNKDYWLISANVSDVNVWGHRYRFCGMTGGYTDGVGYFDKFGAATSKVLAFPETVCFDMATVNNSTGEVFQFQYNYQYSGNLTLAAAQASNASFSTASFPSGWRTITRAEGNRFFYQPNTYNGEQPPFDAPGAFYTWWTNDLKAGTTTAFNIRNDLLIATSAVGGAAGRAFPVRTANISELTI